MRTVPWAMALHAPLLPLPWTMISAPALSQPTSSETPPMISMVVPGNPLEPMRWPGEPVMVTWIGSSLDIQSLPPMPCWPTASTSILRAPSRTARWMRSSRMRDSMRTPSSWPLMRCILLAILYTPVLPGV